MIERDKLVQIRITERTKTKIKNLADRYGYKEVTVIEYLLSGKLSLEELI